MLYPALPPPTVVYSTGTASELVAATQTPSPQAGRTNTPVQRTFILRVTGPMASLVLKGYIARGIPGQEVTLNLGTVINWPLSNPDTGGFDYFTTFVLGPGAYVVWNDPTQLAAALDVANSRIATE